ncbi:MAG: hypothetical protein ACSHXF_07835 [Aquaticitalea sp.]
MLSFALRPIYYVGQIGYYELNIDTIIQKYCVNKDKPELQCNGKCHLATQLQIVNTSDESQQLTFILEAFFPVFVVEFQNFDLINASTQFQIPQMFSYSKSYAHLLELRIDKPPIA